MNLDIYDFKTNEGYLDYEFYSEGPNGRIKKIVRFTPQNSQGIVYFNLSLHDWNEVNRKLDDHVISNNGDSSKVLATVGSIVLEFSKYFPASWIYAEGNSPSRNRLYRMAITKYWDEIEPLFHLYGHLSNEWETFQKRTNYNSFLILRKNCNL